MKPFSKLVYTRANSIRRSRAILPQHFNLYEQITMQKALCDKLVDGDYNLSQPQRIATGLR